MADGPSIAEDDPDDVFAALANDTRIEILRTLWSTSDNTASFSELRERVGVRDSGQFNYHLDQLRDRFVRRTDQGYALTHQGQLIYGAIAAGSYTMSGEIEPITLDDPCPTCGGERTLTYERDRVEVDCNLCPVQIGFAVPPGALAPYDSQSIPEVASRYVRASFGLITGGFCFYCQGRTAPTIGPINEVYDVQEISDDDRPPEIAELLDRWEAIPWVSYACRRCGVEATIGPDLVLLDHPVVGGFFHDHGVDVRTEPIWSLGIGNPGRSTILERDPFRASVHFTVEDERLTVTIDDELAVVDTSRSPG